MTIPHQQDEHWLIVVLGQFAGVMEFMFSFACSAFIVNFLQNQYPVLTNQTLSIPAIFVFVFLLNVILVLIHEMGHALAAWSVGRRVHLICVGIVGFAPRIGRFRIVRKSGAAEYAGFVETSPVWPDLSNTKSIWVSLGGPLATGLTGTIFLLFWYRVVGRLEICACRLLPYGHGRESRSHEMGRGSASDGLRIWLNWRGNIWTPDIWAATRLSVQDRGGDIVSDTEWTELRPLVRQPFYGGTEFRQLLLVAALEKNDTEMLDALGKLHKEKAISSEST